MLFLILLITKNIFKFLFILFILLILAVIWPHKHVTRFSSDTSKVTFELELMSNLKLHVQTIQEQCKENLDVKVVFYDQDILINCEKPLEMISIIKKEKYVLTNNADGKEVDSYPLGLFFPIRQKFYWSTRTRNDGKIIIKGYASSVVNPDKGLLIDSDNYWLFDPKSARLTFITNGNELNWPQ